MAPVKKLAITFTSLTALALVMSACAGNLEAKKLGGRTGVLGKLDRPTQPLLASEDGSASFNETCIASDELLKKSEGETEISAADLVDGKSNKYILLRNEIFVSEETKGQKALTLLAKGEGEAAAIVCHNSKEGSPEVRIERENPSELDSNDGSASQVRVTEFVTNNAKIGARTFVASPQAKKTPIEALTDAKKSGAQLLITKDNSGVVRIRYAHTQESQDRVSHNAQLTVYKAITAEEAEAAKVAGQEQAEEEAKNQPKTAQEAADAVAREAGIPTPDQQSSATTSTTQPTTAGTADNGEEAELTEEQLQAIQDKVAQRTAEISAEIARKLAERHAAAQEQKAKEVIAAHEAQQAQQANQAKAPPCLQSSQDAACPNDSMNARIAYQQQQAEKAKQEQQTTTTTTQPRSGRAADENDVKNGPRGH